MTNTWLHINLSPGQLLAVHPVSVQVVVQHTRLLLVGRLITSSRAAAIGWPTHYVTARDCYWLMALAGHYKSRSTAVDHCSVMQIGIFVRLDKPVTVTFPCKNLSPGQLLAEHPVSVQVVVQRTCLLLVGHLITSSRTATIGWPTHYVMALDCYWLMACLLYTSPSPRD